MKKAHASLDQGFLRAYSNQRTHHLGTSAEPIGHASNDLRIKLTVTASLDKVRAAFEPVAATQERATRQLNQVAKLGYRLPKSSTR